MSESATIEGLFLFVKSLLSNPEARIGQKGIVIFTYCNYWLLACKATGYCLIWWSQDAMRDHIQGVQEAQNPSESLHIHPLPFTTFTFQRGFLSNLSTHAQVELPLYMEHIRLQLL